MVSLEGERHTVIKRGLLKKIPYVIAIRIELTEIVIDKRHNVHVNNHTVRTSDPLNNTVRMR